MSGNISTERKVNAKQANETMIALKLERLIGKQTSLAFCKDLSTWGNSSVQLYGSNCNLQSHRASQRTSTLSVEWTSPCEELWSSYSNYTGVVPGLSLPQGQILQHFMSCSQGLPGSPSPIFPCPAEPGLQWCRCHDKMQSQLKKPVVVQAVTHQRKWQPHVGNSF